MGCRRRGTLSGEAGRCLGVRIGSAVVDGGSEICRVSMGRDRRAGRSNRRQEKAVTGGAAGEGASDVSDVPGAAVVDRRESDRYRWEGEKRWSSTGGVIGMVTTGWTDKW